MSVDFTRVRARLIVGRSPGQFELVVSPAFLEELEPRSRAGSAADVEDELERVINGEHLVQADMGHRLAKSACVDRADHLAHYPRGLAS